MSTGEHTIPNHTAQAWAHHLLNHLSGLLKDSYRDAKIVGSVRRDKPYVADVEIVIKPAMTMRNKPTQIGLFGSGESERVSVNLLLERLDELDAAGAIIAHRGTVTTGGLDENGKPTPLKVPRTFEIVNKATGEAVTFKVPGCWGQKQRRFHLPNVLIPFELFLADDDNWGPMVAIRTGPGDFSKSLVCQLRAKGTYEQKDGYVKYIAGTSRGSIRPCPTEAEYFQLCGYNGVPSPHIRHTLAR